MTLTDLLNKELTNLYAITKQINNYLNGSDISFFDEKNQIQLGDYLKANCQYENHISEKLDKLNINPTNTQDSIITEIIENLQQIADSTIQNNVKSEGYLMSLNRLMCYQIANFKNIEYLDQKEQKFQSFNDFKKDLLKLKDKLL